MMMTACLISLRVTAAESSSTRSSCSDTCSPYWRVCPAVAAQLGGGTGVVPPGFADPDTVEACVLRPGM